MKLGAGRIVYQDLTRINKAIAEGALGQSKVLQEMFAHARWFAAAFSGACLRWRRAQPCFASGCPGQCRERSGRFRYHGPRLYRWPGHFTHAEELIFWPTLNRDLQPSGARIVTVIGRYYAMDRDKRWDRTKLAWDAIVFGEGKFCEESLSAAVTQEYAHGKTDEFLPPLIFALPNEQRIRDGDVVFFFNFRADRARQLSQALLVPDFKGFDRRSSAQGALRHDD